MKTIAALIEFFMGAALGIVGVVIKDTDMLVVGCTLMICGKIDLNN